MVVTVLNRICSVSGCSQTSPSGGKCAYHKKEYEQYRGSAWQRGYNREYQELRKTVMTAHPICQFRTCTERSAEVDHIIPLKWGGKNELSNLRALCRYHNRSKGDR